MRISLKNTRRSKKGISRILAGLTVFSLLSAAQPSFANSHDNSANDIGLSNFNFQKDQIVTPARLVDTDQTDENVNSDNDISLADEEYADEYCAGKSFAKKVFVGKDDNLWDIVDNYVRKNGQYYSPDYWLNFSNKRQLQYPWHATANEKKGVLFLLPQNAQYFTQKFLGNWDNNSGKAAPRFGLCALNYPNNGQVAELKLEGKNPNVTRNGESFITAPLYIESAQVEFFGVNLNADKVNHLVGGIGLAYNSKLLFYDVLYARNSDDNTSIGAGLVLNFDSFFSFSHSTLEQNTHASNLGAMLYNEKGRVRCNGNSKVSVGPELTVFLGASTEIDLETCNFHSQPAVNSTLKSVLYFDLYSAIARDIGEIQCNVSDYRYCKHSKNPADDRLPNGKSCSEYIPQCYATATKFEMTDNTFSGNWQYIIIPEWVSFLFQKNNRFETDYDGNKLGSATECSRYKSLKGQLDIDDKVCVPEIDWTKNSIY